MTATGAISEATARSLLKIDEGDRFDFYDWQDDRDRLSRWLLDNGYYEGRVVARRNPPTPPPMGATEQSPVDLSYIIETGPRTELTITGIEVPDKVRRQLVTAWVDVPVDGLLREEFEMYLRPWLAEQGYLRPEIDLAMASGPGALPMRPTPTKVAAISIAPGNRSTERVVVYTGNEGLTDADLDKAMAGVVDRVWTSPGDAKATVLAAYRRNGYLLAQATVGEVRIDGARAELPIRIEEGPQFRAGTVRIEGVGEVDGVDPKPPVAGKRGAHRSHGGRRRARARTAVPPRRLPRHARDRRIDHTRRRRHGGPGVQRAARSACAAAGDPGGRRHRYVPGAHRAHDGSRPGRGALVRSHQPRARSAVRHGALPHGEP